MINFIATFENERKDFKKALLVRFNYFLCILVLKNDNEIVYMFSVICLILQFINIIEFKVQILFSCYMYI